MKKDPSDYVVSIDPEIDEKESEMVGELVVYEGGIETIICTLEDESNMLNEYFSEYTYRKIEDYDRCISKGPVQVVAKMRVKSY